MDRRTFIRNIGGVALWRASGATPVLARPPGDTPAPDFESAGVVVFDPSLERGRRLARVAARCAMPAFALEADADIGALWHARIAPRIGRHAVLATALRPADTFVLERFAAPLDCRLSER
jgi:hypothetical protein